MKRNILHKKVDQDKLKRKIQLENALNQIEVAGFQMGVLLGNKFEFFFKEIPAVTHFSLLSILLKKMFKDAFKKSSAFGTVNFVNYSTGKKDIAITQCIDPENRHTHLIAHNVVFYRSLILFYRWFVLLLRDFAYHQSQAKKLIINAGFTPKQAAYVYRYYFYHLYFALGYECLLNQSQAKLLLFTHERNRFASILAVAAKKKGIKTANVIHGSCFHPPKGYVPVLSDHLLIWGAAHRSIFSFYGTEESRMEVIGFPLNGGRHSKHKAKEKLQVPLKNKVVVFAIELKDMKSGFISDFKQFLECHVHMDVTFLVKVHPTKVKTIPIELLAGSSGGFVIPGILSVNEVMAFSDLVIGLNSTILIEALSFEVPTLIFNYRHYEGVGVGDYIHQFGNAPYLRGMNALKEFFQQENWENRLNRESQFEYYRELCEYNSEESVNKIISFINQKSK